MPTSWKYASKLLFLQLVIQKQVIQEPVTQSLDNVCLWIFSIYPQQDLYIILHSTSDSA